MELRERFQRRLVLSVVKEEFRRCEGEVSILRLLFYRFLCVRDEFRHQRFLRLVVVNILHGEQNCIALVMHHPDVLECLQVYPACFFKLPLDFVGGCELRVEVSVLWVEPNRLPIGGNRLRIHLMREIERAEFLLSFCAICLPGYESLPFFHRLLGFAKFNVECAKFPTEAGIPGMLFQRIAVEC